MDENIEMLNYIYQNASMGKTTIEQILKEVKDLEFRYVLKEELKDYEHVIDECDTLLSSKGKLPKDIDAKAKVATYLNIKLDTLRDDTSSHIADMMMKGSNMGIIDITKNLNKYDNIDREIIRLANKLLKIEQRNVEDLKSYL